MCVEYDKTKQTPSNKIVYDIYIYDRHNIRTHVCVFLFNMKKTGGWNYREFDLEGDLVGVPHTWYLSAQSFITLF